MPTAQSTIKKPVSKRDTVNTSHVVPVSPPKRGVLERIRLASLFSDNELYKSVLGRSMRICGGKYAGKQGIVENRLGFVIVFRSATNANETFSVHKSQYAQYSRVVASSSSK